MKKILMVAALGMLIISADAQDKKVEKKVDRKVNIVKNDDQINLKVVENGKTVIDKTYTSMDELQADPEVQALKIKVGSPGKAMMYKDKDGNKTKFDGESGLVWIWAEVDEDHDIDFDTDSNEHVNIRKDADGNIVIDRNGEVVDIKGMEGVKQLKVKKLEDGSFEVEDENGIRIVSTEEMEKGNAMFFSGDDVKAGGTNVFHFKDGEGDGKIIELKGDAVWMSDSLHEKAGNVIFIREESDIRIDGDGEGKTIIIREQRVDGDHSQVVRIVVDKLHVKISDLEDLATIEEIPGSQVVSNKMLDLEEVNYYPNPSDGTFNLRFASKKKPTQIRVIDMMGKEVYAENLKDFDGYYDKSIDLSSSEKGVYILQVLQGEKSWNKKLVIE